MNTDPWEGLGPVWYWDTRRLNRYADQGDFEMITRRINGGLNGYEDRCRRYTQIGLLALGYSPNSVTRFQTDHGLKPDGIPGPRTRAKIHELLTKLDTVAFLDPFAEHAPEKVSSAPFWTTLTAYFSTLLTPKGFL